MIGLKDFLKRAFITRKCILCGDVIDYERETPFCDECLPEWLNNLDFMCVKCGFDCDFCTCLPERVREISHLSTFGVFYTPKASTPVNRIVYKMKREHNFPTIRFCAKILAKKVVKSFAKNGTSYKDFVITYPARRKKSIIKYGYDHAELLAKELSKFLRLEYVKVFKNLGAEEQKALTKTQRFSNASGAYEIIKGANVKNKKFLIVDDVMTSGATLNICSKMLLSEGASAVVPIAFAKDTKTTNSSN